MPNLIPRYYLEPFRYMLNHESCDKSCKETTLSLISALNILKRYDIKKTFTKNLPN